MEWLTVDSAVGFIALAALEIVLGIDNVIYIAILCEKLPPSQRDFARQAGLLMAMGIRIALLFCITWLAGLTDPIFSISIANHNIAPSIRDMVLGLGGLVLMAKAVIEMHHQIEGPPPKKITSASKAVLSLVLVQICLMDIVFSIDSVITAIGMANRVSVMVAAIIIAVFVMTIFAKKVSEVVTRHPTLKTLALAFLVLIGAGLLLEGIKVHIPKGAIYFAMAFSLGVELINIKIRSRHKTPTAPPSGS